MRRALFGVAAMLAASLAVLGPTVSGARAVEAADKSAIRSVIERQLDAFKHDDAPGAYAFAAPNIRRIIPSHDDFIDMVKRSYKPVYRPRSYAFGESRETDAGLDQALNIQDEEGGDWVAVYSMEKQPDGSWNITGCALVKAPGTTV